MNWFLKCRHWQLFLLMIVLPVCLQLAITAIAQIRSPYAILLTGQLLGSGSMMLVFLGWFYSIITRLKEQTAGLNINISRVRLFTLIPLIYMFLLLLLSTYFGLQGEGIFLTGIVLLCLHLFSMFCIFYCMYMAAKTLKSAALQRPVTFNDFAGEFFLLWFFPVGIWILQPRINKLAAQAAQKEMDIFRS